MRRSRDLMVDVGLSLDNGTAERLLRGLQPDDAPPGFAEVFATLAALANVEPADAGMARVTVAAMAAVIDERTVDPFLIEEGSDVMIVKGRERKFLRARFVAVAAATVLIGTGGLAMAGELPGAAQSMASSMSAKLGIEVPGPNEHAGDHPDTRGASDASSDPSVADAVPGANDQTSNDAPGSGKGSEISHIATTTTATGVLKGAEICTAASDGQCQAGQHGAATQDHGQSGQDHGQSGQAQGQSGQDHGQSGQDHGQSGQDHGQSGQEHGQSGQVHGQGSGGS
jgi:hypothetical protein